MDTKEVLNLTKKLNFTLKSLWVALILFVVVSVIVCINPGFSGDNYKTTVILLCTFFVLTFVYIMIVISLYKVLPRNKSKDNIGVLFIINTHGNSEDYKNIREKFIENFEHLRVCNDECQINPIVLSEKNVIGLKYTGSEKEDKRIMLKTNCLIIVHLRTYDIGKKSTEYQLQISAKIFHPKMNEIVEKVFSKNINTIFSGLNVNVVNREKDLKTLQGLSSKLFYVCRIICAVANEYTGFYAYARKVFTSMYNKLEKVKDPFYIKLKKILLIELFHCDRLILSDSYEKYLRDGQYDSQKTREVLNDLSMILKINNNPDVMLCLNSFQAIDGVLTNDLGMANDSLQKIKTKFNYVKRNDQSWAYSEAFVYACQANVKQYKEIEKKYRALKNNRSQQVEKIYFFINNYIYQHPENIGVKLALFWLAYYRKDLSLQMISQEFVSQLVKDLTSRNCDTLANDIEAKFGDFINEL